MILRSLHLRPFAGIVDRRADFLPGLNVVLGANEAGKSTLLRALRCILFTPSPLTPARLKREMAQCMPAAGGDTVRVALSFTVGGKEGRIEKSWGGTQRSVLTLAGTGEFTDPVSVDGRLKDILVLNEGTFDKVLITQQSHLAGTLQSLRDEGDELANFSDMLRKSILESGGISAGHLLDVAKEGEQEYFRRWDEAADGPEGGKGADHEWQKGVGSILQAYYALRSCERDLAKAEDYDRKMDEFVRKGAALESRVAGLKKYIETHRAIVEDARNRAVLEPRRRLLVRELSEMKDAASNWPKSEAKAEILGASLQKLRAQFEDLRKEETLADAFEKQKAQRALYEQARTQYDTLKEAEKNLSSLQVVSEADAKDARSLFDDLKRLDVQIAAQQLTLELRANTPFRAELRTPLGETKSISLASGGSARDSIGGQFVLNHDEWSLTVSAGTGDVGALFEKRRSLEMKLGQTFAAHRVESLDELIARQSAHKQQRDVVERHRAALHVLTRGKSFDAIEEEVQAMPEAVPSRAIQEIRREIDKVTDDGTQMRTEHQLAVKYVDECARKYGDQQSLQNLLLGKLGEEKELEKELSSLKPLPEGFGDANTFISDFNDREAELNRTVDELHSVHIARKEYEKNAPDDTLDELTENIREKRAAFEQARQRGLAYRRIRQELESILAHHDKNAYVPFQHRIESMMKGLTGGRYSNVVVEKGLPGQLVGDGTALPVALLSSGTLDVLALAVRLSMAEYYLQGNDGFVMMDDPLVNLDPDRQRAATDFVREFATRQQVIVLTCHPSHAEMLGGNRVGW